MPAPRRPLTQVVTGIAPPTNTIPPSPSATAPGTTAPNTTTPAKPSKPPKPTGGTVTGGRGGGQAAGGNYGLNPNDKTPFNVFTMPKTVGQFNKLVLQLAKSSYMPQLNQSKADVAAENFANTQRNRQIGSIYTQYGNQAQQAYNTLYGNLKDIIGQNAIGDRQSAAVLDAALSSAQGAPNTLGAMMGISGPVSQTQIEPYEAAAQGAAQGTGSELKALSGDLLTQAGNAVANAPLEQAYQSNIESARHTGALTGLQQTRANIVAQIPAAVATARENLIKDLQAAEGLKFQQGLANRQFGLAQTTEQDKTSLARAQLRLAWATEHANQAATNRKLDLTQQQIDNQAAAIKASTAKTRAVTRQALAAAKGKREANGIAYLTQWVQPTARELSTTSTTTHGTGSTPSTTTTHGSKLAAGWYRNPMDAYNQLTRTYGFSPLAAYTLMSGFTSTPIGRGSGETIGQWAQAHLAVLAAKGGSAAGRGVAQGGIDIPGLQGIANLFR